MSFKSREDQYKLFYILEIETSQLVQKKCLVRRRALSVEIENN